eukprot:TRINITY_DN5265_c0_g1_i1.p1 TRINITY_DN5265_c0_g1~~TRINITY_DN5265_c0_g1_i1.p1  ORF type:complete len:238 (-),score=65.52 TRINITY_DN5265_c0_g1_i1:232-945(-)
MSLALVQEYSSEEEETTQQIQWSDGEEQDEIGNKANGKDEFTSSISAAAASQKGSLLLPSAFDVFSEVKGPPDFLNNSIHEPIQARSTQRKKTPAGWQSEKDNQSKKDKYAGAVVEAKAQLVGIHDRVRSDVGGGLPKDSATLMPPPKNVPATLPPPEGAANLLRICLQCGVPKTLSNATEGMVCPVCRDQPCGLSEKEKKRGSVIKEKEKAKRMKGQSSHATWKSDTEMQLRQQFD